MCFEPCPHHLQVPTLPDPCLSAFVLYPWVLGSSSWTCCSAFPCHPWLVTSPFPSLTRVAAQTWCPPLTLVPVIAQLLLGANQGNNGSLFSVLDCFRGPQHMAACPKWYFKSHTNTGMRLPIELLGQDWFRWRSVLYQEALFWATAQGLCKGSLSGSRFSPQTLQTSLNFFYYLTLLYYLRNTNERQNQ